MHHVWLLNVLPCSAGGVRKPLELAARRGHVGEEVLGRVHAGVDGACECACRFDVAHPVVAYDDAALSPFMSHLEKLVLGGNYKDGLLIAL